MINYFLFLADHYLIINQYCLYFMFVIILDRQNALNLIFMFKKCYLASFTALMNVCYNFDYVIIIKIQIIILSLLNLP